MSIRPEPDSPARKTPPEGAEIHPESADATQPQSPQDLWSLRLRLLIPIIGVLALGWPQFTAALFYLFEAWLFLTVRATNEFVVGPDFRKLKGFKGFRTLIVTILALALFFAMLGGVAVFALLGVFLKSEGHEFAASGWRSPSFLLSVAFLVFEQIRDVVRFTRAFPGRTYEQQRRDEFEKLSRVVALVACNFIVAVGTWINLGGYFLIISMSCILYWIESSPLLRDAFPPPGPAKVRQMRAKGRQQKHGDKEPRRKRVKSR